MNSIEEKKQIIDRLIPDKNVQNIIFNYDNNYVEFLSDGDEYIRYLNNLMNFTAVTTYRVFLDWKRKFNEKKSEEKDLAISKFSNSMIRIYNLFDSCYDIKKLDFDFIENLIVDFQIDNALQIGTEKFLKTIGIDKWFNFTNNLTKYIYILKRRRLSSRYNTEFSFKNLCEVFEMFTYISKIKVTYYEYALESKKSLKSIRINWEQNEYNAIDIGKLLCVLDNSCYLLESFNLNDPKKLALDNNKEQTLYIEYVPFMYGAIFKVAILNSTRQNFNFEYIHCQGSAIETFLLDYDIINVDITHEGSYLFRDCISFNNRYIKYLALIISDFISFETKKRIFSEYKEKYNSIFEKLHIKSLCDNDSLQNYRWDEIIIFMLIEEGIYNFLVFLLKYEAYSSFINGFHLRFGEKINIIRTLDKTIDRPAQNLQFENDDNKTSNQAKKLIHLATKLLSVGSTDFLDNCSPASIYDIIKDLEKKSEVLGRGNYERVSYYINVLVRVVLFLDTFYNGLTEYMIRRKLDELSFGETWFPSHQEYKDTKIACLKGFSSRVESQKKNNIGVGKLSIENSRTISYYNTAMEIVKAVFEKFIRTNDTSRERCKPMNEAIFDALGRRQIFEASEMLEHMKNIINCIDGCKNGLGISAFDKLANELHDTIKAFFIYLSGYSFDNSAQIESSIYPIVGFYSDGVRSLDGYRYSHMIINNSQKDKPLIVKMIADEEYLFNEAYYCIPNIDRVANIYDAKTKENEHIWINPVVIPQKYYTSNINAHFSRLSEDDDLAAAGAILYYTDTKIYKNLFGTVENAMKMLPVLFKNPNSIFYKNYFYVIKIENQIVAIASLYPTLPKWNSDIIEKTFGDLGIKLPDTTKLSYAYFIDTFKDTIGSENNIICDLCVHDGYRNRGIAKCMLANIIRKSEDDAKNLMISVYSDNLIAIHLYTEMGFISYMKDSDTRGGQDSDQVYIRMIKYT